jgi:hypothetical protein
MVSARESPHPSPMAKKKPKWVPKDDDLKARKLFAKIMRELTSPKNRRRSFSGPGQRR